MQAVTLNSGHQMPVVGLGTWRSPVEDETVQAVVAALDAGYRHIDTAFNYNTEEAIGKAVKRYIEDGKATREELFITTKLPNVANRPGDVAKYLQMSLDRLQMNYVDLYLIHMPFGLIGNEETHAPLWNEDGTVRLDTATDNLATWKEMEKQVKRGAVKSIGLSNFNIQQVRKICDNSTIKPSVLQVELHAYHRQRELVDECRRLGIAVTAYSPLGSPGADRHFAAKYNYSVDNFPDILNHPVVREISEKHGRTPGQILLKDIVQNGIVAIPKSLNPERIKNNIDLFGFELDEEDVAKLKALDKGAEGRIFDFLFLRGVDKHPEYPFKPSPTEQTP